MSDAARILVVDDEQVVLTSVRKILTRAGHDVDTAETAQEGLDRLDDGHYDLLITDLMMPEMDGIEMLRVLREKALAVPSIMITGYPTINTGIQALRLGAVDYVPKPFTRQELLSPVQRALRAVPNESADGPDDEPPAPSAEQPEGDEPAVLLPGQTFYLPKHSWATYEQEGTVAVGVETSFLAGAGRVTRLEPPAENDLVEQGYPCVKLETDSGETHTMFAPLSGRVIAVNADAVADPGALTSDTWLVRLLPSRLHDEVKPLKGRWR